MATLVTFHAHPDDEAISCGGTMAKYAAEGHRVVLVSATKGEHGEVAEGFLDDDETLGERRVEELRRAADTLGVARLEFLGYVDSGMMGTPTNDAPESFWRADVEDAAQRLAAILGDESADVLTIYDADGGYGHPDHIQVYRVGLRAAEIAGTPRVYESVVGREMLREGLTAMLASGIEVPFDPDELNMGVPDDTITTTIDVSDYLEVKRAAMRAHASQIPESSFFLSLPDDAFAGAFGSESFRLIGTSVAPREIDLLSP